MKLFLGIIVVTFIGKSEGHGCSTSCCYTPVKFYCCQCESQPTAKPTAITPTIMPTQPSIITVTGGSSVNVVTSNVVNDVKLNNDIKLENQINNVNKISNPISIHQTNINSISNTVVTRKPIPLVTSAMPIVIPITTTTTTERSKCETIECQKCEPQKQCQNTCQSCAPRQEQCCTVIKPCSYQGCQHTTQTCGHQCIAPVVYIPYNPCPSYGCFKRSYWGHTRCAQKSCHYVRRDCSQCHHTFYQTYSTFLQCYGCYLYGGSYGGGYVY